MSGEGQKVGDVDMATLVAELRRQNEEMLEKHKAELERQFAAQMTSALSQLKPSDPVSQFVRGRVPLRPDDLDSETERFRQSAMNLETAPKYTVADGARKGVTLRASVEGRGTSTSYSVKTKAEGSGGTVASSNASGRSKTSKKTRAGGGLVDASSVDPRFAKYAEPVWDVSEAKKKRAAAKKKGQGEGGHDAVDDLSVEELANLDTTIVDYYGEPLDTKQLSPAPKPKRDGPKKATYSELGDVTGYLLRKSEFMLNDADKTTKRKKKKKAAAKRQQQQQQRQQQQQISASTGSLLPPINIDDDYGGDGDDDYAYEEDYEAGAEFASVSDGAESNLLPVAWQNGNDGGGDSQGPIFPVVAQHGDSQSGASASVSRDGARPSTAGSHSLQTPGARPSANGTIAPGNVEGHANAMSVVLSPIPAPTPKGPPVRQQSYHEVVDLEPEPIDPNQGLHPDLHGRRVMDWMDKTKSQTALLPDDEGRRGEYDEKDDDGDADGDTLQLTKQQQEVQDEDEGEDQNAFDPVGWENNIARHILSMYASTKYGEDEYNSKVILDYTDRSKTGSVEDLKKELSEDPLAGTFESRVKGWDDDVTDLREAEQRDGEGEGEYANDSFVEDSASTPVKTNTTKTNMSSPTSGNVGVDTRIGIPTKKPSPDRMKESGLPLYADAKPPASRTHFGRSHYSDEIRSTVNARKMGQARYTKKPSIYDKDATKNKYRTQTKILTKDFREVTIRGLPKAYCIWFSSTSDVYSDWTLLPGGEKLQAQLAAMLERKRYFEYLGIVETLMNREWAAALDREGGSGGLLFALKNAAATATYYQKYPKAKNLETGGEGDGKQGAYDPDAPDGIGDFSLPGGYQNESGIAETGRRVLQQAESASPFINKSHDHISLLQLMVLWRQLVVTGNAFACLCLNEKKNELAMQFLQRTKLWANREDILPIQKRNELRGYVCDALAFYYFRQRKAAAALSEARKACKLLDKSGIFDAVAIGKLHVAAVLCQQAQFRESHRVVYEVIAMVEEGRLAFDEANPKQLCIVAVAYHNLAVVQLKLEMSDLACKNSMNARKIARLCLSFSNRWVHVFQYTHECALEDAKYRLDVKRKEGTLDERQLRVMKELTDAMFEHATM